MGLKLKPTKTDKAAHFKKTFVAHQREESLSSGEAIQQISAGDRAEGGDENTPLFRDESGKEVKYEDSNRVPKEALVTANLSDLGEDTHLLWIGVAIAYANSPFGRELIAGFIGLWLSGAKYDYLHATRDRLEQVRSAIAIESGMKLAVRPGPASGYAVKGC